MARQLSFWVEGDDWSKAELVRWLDNEIHHGGTMVGLPKSESQAWLLRLVDGLLTTHNADLRVLVRKRHDLARVAITRLSDHGRRQVRATAQMLIDGRTPRRLETSMDVAAVMEEQDYTPYHKYHGTFVFPKHAFDLIGEMGDEESQCAKRIADHSNVKRWIRNLSNESAGGFSLPLSPGNFFPDFIAELVDGRIAIIEYKGKHLALVPDELHKKEVGELWAARSNGACVFVWVVDRDWATLEMAIEQECSVRI
jgi:type III restriction enzyme